LGSQEIGTGSQSEGVAAIEMQKEVTVRESKSKHQQAQECHQPGENMGKLGYGGKPQKAM
jgi:hypothetical protein